MQVNTPFSCRKIVAGVFFRSDKKCVRIPSFSQVNHHKSVEKITIPTEVAMKAKTCPSCGSQMKRNGRTSSGSQRWRCRSCGASDVHRYDVESRDLKRFLDWLLGKGAQLEMPGGGRSFRRRAERLWSIWPVPGVIDEVHRVVYVDGICISRNVVVLTACSDTHVLSWYLARAEATRAWRALLSRIAPPDVVATDGGSGFASAVAAERPRTRVQRCVFHAFRQVRRCTTSRPKLQAGVELYGLALELMRLDDLRQAEWWSERFGRWCGFWAGFLEERTAVDGRREYAHERLRKARRALVSLSNSGTLFTYLDPELAAEGPLPRTNDRIEGGVNAQIRAMLRNHRGMSELRRVKAVFWWCHMHTECPLGAAELLGTMPTDADIDLLYELYAENPRESDAPSWGDGLVWRELHRSTPYPYAID